MSDEQGDQFLEHLIRTFSGEEISSEVIRMEYDLFLTLHPRFARSQDAVIFRRLKAAGIKSRVARVRRTDPSYEILRQSFDKPKRKVYQMPCSLAEPPECVVTGAPGHVVPPVTPVPEAPGHRAAQVPEVSRCIVPKTSQVSPVPQESTPAPQLPPEPLPEPVRPIYRARPSDQFFQVVGKIAASFLVAIGLAFAGSHASAALSNTPVDLGWMPIVIIAN